MTDSAVASQRGTHPDTIEPRDKAAETARQLIGIDPRAVGPTHRSYFLNTEYS
jgi:hypothetical protein